MRNDSNSRTNSGSAFGSISPTQSAGCHTQQCLSALAEKVIFPGRVFEVRRRNRQSQQDGRQRPAPWRIPRLACPGRFYDEAWRVRAGGDPRGSRVDTIVVTRDCSPATSLPRLSRSSSTAIRWEFVNGARSRWRLAVSGRTAHDRVGKDRIRRESAEAAGEFSAGLLLGYAWSRRGQCWACRVKSNFDVGVGLSFAA